MADDKTITMDDVVKMDSRDIGEVEQDIIVKDARKEYEIESGKRKPEEKSEEKPEEKAEEKKEPEVKEPEKNEEKEEAIAAAKQKEAEKAEAKAAKETKDAEDKAKEDERILNAKDEELKDEEKSRKAELVKAKEEAEVKKEEEAVKAFSEKKKLPIEEAKKERDHIKKIIKDTFKDNQEEMAYGYLNIQRAYARGQEDLKAMREQAPVRAIEKMSEEEILNNYIDSGKLKVKGVVLTIDAAIEQYRLAKPKQTEAVDDSVVLAMISDSIRQQVMLRQKEEIVNAKVTAKDRRDEIISGLSEDDKKYSDEIREVVNAMPDHAILGEGFNSGDIILWAKGKKVEEIESNLKAEVKKSYDEGYKKGKEEAKILGVKAGEAKGSGQPQKKTPTLNEREKKEALDMFDIDSMTEDDKYEAYIEVKKKKEK